MIYLTGDTHGDFTRFNTKNFPEQKEMTKDDYVIICGDFGGVWNTKEESKSEKHNLDWLNGKPFTLLFIDGNHENFDRLFEYPVTEWHGGYVHVIRPHILHLMRGQVFEIDEKKIFTFGGASSHDISGGILDPDAPNFEKNLKQALQGYEPFRVKNISWWERELPTEDEMEEGRKNLGKHGNTVDYIITHCCSSSTQAVMSHGMYKPDFLTDYLEEIRQKTAFKKWFFGHYHDNRNINAEEILIYEQMIRIS